jgi:hypothetical protein
MTGKAQASGLLAPHADGFAGWLAGRGYSPSAVERQLRLMDRLSRWLADERISLEALSEDAALRFARTAGRKRLTVRGVAPVLEYLRSTGTVPPPRRDSPRKPLLLAYERYLAGERSLSQATVTKYAHIAEAFLGTLPDPLDDALTALSAVQVHAFVLSRGAGGQEHGRRAAVAAALPLPQRGRRQAACRGGTARRGLEAGRPSGKDGRRRGVRGHAIVRPGHGHRLP